MYYFYILRCVDGSLYCGITTNLERRIQEHNSATAKAAKYTRAKQPVTLVYSEQHPNLSFALKREAEVKRWTKTRKERLINPDRL
ncbi:MAG: hypothetical protein RI947_251 [Candidatus Parcubacteria bacterium]|jgi:putative endonuclease